MNRHLSIAVWTVLVALSGLLVAPPVLAAHEVPARVVVQTYVRPDATSVKVLVRVPLAAMRDVEFPVRGAAGYLDLARADSTLRDAARLWVADAITLTADGMVLPLARIASARAALPSDHAFEQYETALQSVTGAPLPAQTDIVPSQAMLDVMLEYPLADINARLAIQSRFGHLGVKTTTVVRFLTSASHVRVFTYDGDEERLQLEPQWWHAAARFVSMGFSHLLQGWDHLLFLLCLVLPVRRLRPLIGIVTAFTVAHSITLVASVMGFAPDALWFPPLVELVIAASIVYMAIENVVGSTLERRWMVAFGFGLVHGFGFSYALKASLQFAGDHLAMALAAFNIGIELGQLCVLLLAVPVLSWLFTKVVAERTGVLIASVLVAHTSWHLMTERFDVVRAYHFALPTLDVASALSLVRMATVVLVATAAAWLMSGVMKRFAVAPSRTTTLLLLCVALIAGASPSALRAQAAAASPSAAPSAARSTKTGVFTADQATKGKEVFAGNCSGCHTVASHSGPAFSVRWMGRPLSEFYEYVSRLMPKSTPGALTEDEYVWVTAYVLSLNGMPAGARELSAEPALLKGIRIDTLVAGVGSGLSKTTGGSTGINQRTRLQ